MKKYFLNLFDIMATLSVIQAVLFLYWGIVGNFIIYISAGQSFGIAFLAAFGLIYGALRVFIDSPNKSVFFLRFLDALSTLFVIQSMLFLYFSLTGVMYISYERGLAIVLLAIFGLAYGISRIWCGNDSQKEEKKC